MSAFLERLKSAIESGTADPVLLKETFEEMQQLQKRVDHLEELLIIMIRTGWPWNEDGMANEILRNSKEGFGSAMQEAKEVLQLDRSRLTRTEPKT